MRENQLHARRAVAVSSLALVTLAPSLAVAAEPASNPLEDPECDVRKVTFDERRYAVHAILGFGSPVGLLGADVEYNPHSRLALGVGVGTGWYRFETAVLARVRPFMFEEPKRAQAITVGVAGSFSSRMDYDGVAVTLDGSKSRVPPAEIEPAYWIQADVGYELRRRNGFSMFVSVGVAWLINQGDATCESGRTGCNNDGSLAPGTVLPPIATLSVGLGLAPQ